MTKKELIYSVDGHINWCSHYGKQYEISSKKIKIELPYDPAIPFLDISKENKNTNSKTYTHTNVHSSIIYNLDFTFLGSKINAYGDSSHKKDTCSLEEKL